jgi:serine/threonine protein kinase/WD40 repeat protein
MTAPSATNAVPSDPRLGTTLGKYRFLRRLGEGGMGVVYEAVDSLLSRKVALKLLPNAVANDPEVLRRFLQEARAAARLSHPNVVGIHEIDQKDGTYFLAMELVSGGSVEQQLTRNGPYSWPEAARVIADACRGLAAAHTAGVIHRDIKPANLMRASDGSVKLADFGLAKAVGRVANGMTGDGTVVGTPNYMSPEQCRAEPVDHRSDIYSLGATLYTLLTGQPPYPADQPLQTMFAHCSSPVPDVRQVVPTLPASCAAVIAKAMQKEPLQRYPSADAMLIDLAAALDDTPSTTATTPQPSPMTTAPTAIVRPLPASSVAELTELTTVVGPKRPSTWLPLVVAAAMVGVLVQIWLALNGLMQRTKQSLAAPPQVAAKTIVPGAPFGGLATAAGNTLNLGSPVTAVAFSPDGRYFAAAPATSQPLGVTVWDYGNGRVLYQLWRDQEIKALTFTPDGKILVAGGSSRHGGIKLWYVNDHRERYLLQDETISNLALTADGKTLAVLGRGVTVLDLATGNILQHLEINVGNPTCLSLSPDGKTLAIGAEGSATRIIDLATGKPVPGRHAEDVRAMTYLADGKDLVSAVGTTLTGLRGHWADEPPLSDSAPLLCLARSRDGHWLACGSEQGGVAVLDLLHADRSSLRKQCPAAVRAVALSADGAVLAAGCDDKAVHLWNLRSASD